MRNYVQRGRAINYTVPAAGVTSGDPVGIGAMCGVATTTGVENDVVSVSLEGVYEIPKEAEAFTLGQKLYLIVANGTLTATVGSNVFFGYAWTAAASGDATVQAVLAK